MEERRDKASRAEERAPLHRAYRGRQLSATVCIERPALPSQRLYYLRIDHLLNGIDTIVMCFDVIGMFCPSGLDGVWVDGALAEEPVCCC